jgi:glutathione reductase (NADPH)
VIVDGERHTARHVVVAVGARPAFPDIPGIDHAVTSDSILEDVYPLPKKLLVVGAGYIGVELASIFNGLGVDTSLILRGDLPLRGFDDDLRTWLTDELEKHGLQIRVQTQVRRIEKQGDGVRLDTNVGPIDGDMVIYATGRKPIPNTGSLGLDEIGVRVNDEGSIYVNTFYETNVEGILAVGDCSDHAGNGLSTGQHDLTPVAIAEGRAVAERLFNNHEMMVAYDTIPTAVFGMPQAGSVGMAESRARALGFDIEVYKTDFKPMLHTLTGMDRRIYMKLVVDKSTSEVIGCHLVGDEAAEIVQGFAVAMTAGATKEQFDATVALHPSAAEEFVTMYQPFKQ